MSEMDNMQYTQPTGPQKAPGMAIASLVLGIVSLVTCCAWYLSVPCSILAVVFAIITLRKGPAGKGMCIAGLICGGVGLVVSIIMVVFVGSVLSSAEFLDEFQRQLDSMT